MKSSTLAQSLAFGLCLATLLTDNAIAQSLDPEGSPTETSTSALDLRIQPRVGVGHTSSGAGVDGISRLEGFMPLFQTPGRRLTFLEGQFLLDNDANIGGNLTLGHRIYDAGSDRIWGGYVAFDHRQTDHSSFNQLGVGLESLGEIWDVRVNGYLPLGDTRQLVDEQRFESGNQTSVAFQGHLLMLENQRTQQTVRTYEAALGGLDAEVGARLAHWEGGDLRGYAGLYLLDGSDSDSTLGWRLRLDADPTETLNLGLSVQDDDRFGTNVMLSVALRFPHTRPRGPLTEAETVVARLGEPVSRNGSIVVDHEQDVETDVSRTIAPLMNPEEEEAYQFQHVTLGGRAGGDGSFERPFATLNDALAAARSDGNAIVYVDAGDRSPIPAFTIPDRVQVLSRGPVQILAGMRMDGFPELPVRLPFSPVTNYDDGILVQLPFSGTGEFPLIQEAGAGTLVTLGDRTTLAGFRLNNAVQYGIVGNQIANVELRDNTLTQAAERGIWFNDVTGSAVLLNNRISTTLAGANRQQGILIQNSTGDALEATLVDHAISGYRVGLEVAATGDRNQGTIPSQNIQVRNTTLEDNQEQGMLLVADGPSNQQVSFQNGTIQANGAEGVRIQATNVASQEVILDDLIIASNGGDGVRVQAGVLDGRSTAAQEVFIRRNTIVSNGGDGISIEGNEVSAQEFAIGENVIRGNGGAGIRAIANNLAFQEYVTDADSGSLGISNNQIANNGGPGITLTANDSAALITDIQGNTLSNNRTGAASEIEVATTSGATRVCVVAVGNTAARGIRFDNNSAGVSGLFEVGDLTELSVNNAAPITLLPDRSTFTNKPGVSSCF